MPSNWPHIEFRRGELVGTARSYLAIHMSTREYLDIGKEIPFPMQRLVEQLELELKRLLNNEFQLHGSDIGDATQTALLILLMAGEEHIASGRHS